LGAEAFRGHYTDLVMPTSRSASLHFQATLFALASIVTPVGAQGRIDAVAPGRVVAEPATETSLAVRWPIVGDRNLNAAVAVAYRKAGTEAWAEGYPLFRTFNDRVSKDNAVADGHLFAGSIVDLEPATEYEVRLTLEDPDGGSAVEALRLRTAAVPVLPPTMHRRHVAPSPGRGSDGSGTSADPFRGLPVALKKAQPGDVLVLAPGTYVGAPFAFPSGTRERPIAIEGPADGSAILDGRGAGVLIELGDREHLWISRLTLRNAGTLIQANHAKHVVVTRNRFEIARHGFRSRGAIYHEAVGFRISDNVFVGPSHWPRTKGIETVDAVNVTGSGHVVSFNLIQNVGDGIHSGSDGRLSATDIHNNDIDVCTDDGIETDYSDTNVRVFRNRITNCFAGISAQPVHGGPVYVFRNTLLNLQYTPFKLHNDTAGLLIFHNTSVKAGIPFAISASGDTLRDVVTRNNLFVGTGSPALASDAPASRTDLDNDGYEWPARGGFATWNGRSYRSTLAPGTPGFYSKHGAIPMGPQLTFAGAFGPPPSHAQRMDRAAHDPRLSPTARAIDKGVPLPNFNDRFGGKGPDLGCCELGEPLPWYGPRAEELKR
jgi:hypothetical protein